VAGARRLTDPALLLLAAAMLASGLLLVVWGSHLSFFLDDWTYILYRRDFSADAFFIDANEHLVAGPVAVWKLLLSGFGLGSALPYRVVSTAMFLLGAWFLFVWIRARLGSWPALFATLPILFFGAAFEDLYWFASISFLGSLTCGMGMLVALDRRDRLGDGFACAWLVGSMLFSSLWFAFAIGAAVDVILRRTDRDWRRRAYVVLIPLGLYALWWLGWGHEAESTISLRNIATTPLFVLDSFASAIGALLGLAAPVEGSPSPAGLDWGRPLAVGLGALAVWRLYKLDRIPRSLWVVLAVVLGFWVLGGFAVKPGRVPWASRYQLPGAMMMLLVATELLRGVKLDRRVLPPALAVLAVALAGNGLMLRQTYSTYLETSQIIQADLAAVEIARDTVEPGFFLDEEFADTGFAYIDAGSYLSAVDAFGSPSYTIGELEGSPEAARFAADKVLLNALRVALVPASGASIPAPDGKAPATANSAGVVDVPAGGCITAPAGENAPLLSLPPGGVVIRAGAEPVTDIQMRRFATGQQFPVDFQTAIGPGEALRLPIPTDLSTVPWKMRLEGAPATVCGLAGRPS
jgi:hypothetical protein